MEIKFKQRKKTVTSKFKELVKEIAGLPDSVRNDTVDKRDFVKFSMRQVNTNNKISGEYILQKGLIPSIRNVLAKDQLSGEYGHHNYTELRISRRRYAVIVVIDKIVYRVDVWGLSPDENMAVGVILLSVAFEMTPSHIMDFAKSPSKGSMPISFYMKDHYIHSILTREADRFNQIRKN